jgi:hypothetical protein
MDTFDRWRRADGSALIVALLTTSVMTAVALGFAMAARTEILVSGHHVQAVAARYAAESGIESVMHELRGVADWNLVLGGAIRSTLVDGLPGGLRRLSDGSTIDLDEATHLANCAHTAPCTAAELASATDDRPWGANNPHWMLFAYGPLSVFAGTLDPALYLVVWIADDPAENDDDPGADGTTAINPVNPGVGVLALRADAFGPGGVHRVVTATVARSASGRLRMLSWHEVR